eukprot:m.448446 g.448446  ORF g.448446 m.448446 type:complete len:117 (-) comp19661_c0_seq1:649-999(-)
MGVARNVSVFFFWFRVSNCPNTQSQGTQSQGFRTSVGTKYTCLISCDDSIRTALGSAAVQRGRNLNQSFLVPHDHPRPTIIAVSRVKVRTNPREFSLKRKCPSCQKEPLVVHCQNF